MSITPQEALQRCIEHRELFHDEMTAMMRLIMSGEMPPELVAGLLVALRTKKKLLAKSLLLHKSCVNLPPQYM